MSHTRLTASLTAATATLALVACSGGSPPTPTPGRAAPGPLLAAPASLHSFDTCDQLLDYYQSNALEHLTPHGLGGGGWAMLTGAVESAASDDGYSVGSTTNGGSDFSGTNNQEADVDEADMVKTDGELIITAHGKGVTIIDTETGDTATVDLPRRVEGGHELLLHGHSLVVLSSEYGGWGHWPETSSDTHPAFHPARTVVTTVDISNPADPVTLGSTRMEGSYRSARLIDGTARLVMVSEPTGVVTTYPANSSLSAEEEALQRNRELIEQTTIEDWLPHVQTIQPDGAVAGATSTQLLDCSQIARPAEFSGFATVSVLTFDLTGAGSLEPTSGTGVIGDGSTVYASTDALIVATSPWGMWQWGPAEVGSRQQVSTDLHLFDISDPDAANYLASGTIEGRLLNQFSLSETDGVIRAATTLDASEEEDSQSSLIVLTAEDGELVETGRLDGLGLDERIYAVRYLSADLAAVVTFREVDPLYLIDTSDPADPALLGELKIPGYSAYLHPIDDQYLLGVGQDADESNGWVQGTQVSLFDISDLTNPARVSQVHWQDSHSHAERDHRAFTYWPATGQVYLPLETYRGDAGEYFGGVVSVGVDTDAGVVSETDRIKMGNSSSWEGAPQRTLVIGDELWTIHHGQVRRHDLHTMEQEQVIRLR